jgi:hypothetical protein
MAIGGLATTGPPTPIGDDMKIKLKTSLSGAYASFNRGDVVEWDDEDSARLIEADFAEAVDIEAKEPAKTKRGKADVASGDSIGSAD